MAKASELKKMQAIQYVIKQKNEKLTDDELSALTSELQYSLDKAKVLQNCIFSKRGLLNPSELNAFVKNPVKTQKAMDMYYCTFNRRTGDIAWWCYEGMINSIIKNKPVWLIDV